MNRKNKFIFLKAPAKINLWLKVGAQAPNGYHQLETVFQEISLHDTLKLKPAPSQLSLKVVPPVISSSQNLILKALRMLRRRLRVNRGMDVELLKRIPVGAGLGGGSSDAAAALWGGWILWKGGMKDYLNRKKAVPKILLECAKKLGADVSFFLQGGCSFGEGRGEKLTPLSIPSGRWIVLIYPRIHISTAKAYSLLDKSRSKKGRGQISTFDIANVECRDLTPSPSLSPNDFEPVIFSKFPQISRVKKTLQSLGCSKVLMSGSGSSVFGFVKTRHEGLRIARQLSRKTWDVFVEKTI